MPSEGETPEITADPAEQTDVEVSSCSPTQAGEDRVGIADRLRTPISHDDGSPSAQQPNAAVESPYDFVVDLDSDNTHANVIRMVGHSQRVLELGPASGYMSRVLREHDCAVVGIELDPELASQAAEICERVIVGDLDVIDLGAELADDSFDVIVAADVLEHLKDPLGALQRLRPFLRRDGYIVVSLPNVAHASVRLALLQGRFQYRELGLIDRTHLRFFTHDTIRQLFDKAELAIVQIHRQEAPIAIDDAPFDLGEVSADLIRDLESDLDARTYQFVIKAVRFELPGLREIQGRLHDQALAQDAAESKRAQAERELAQAERELAEVRPQWQELERALAEMSRREGDVRAALIDAHDLALLRDEELRQTGDRLKLEGEKLAELWHVHTEAKEIILARDREIELLRRETGALRVRLERISRSLPVRAWHIVSGLPPLRWVRARRVAAYNAAVQHLEDADG